MKSYLDRHGPRGLMTVAGVLLVLVWSQVQGLAAFYALWIAIGQRLRLGSAPNGRRPASRRRW